MATGARGEGIIEVGNKEIRVLYTNRALAEAEAQMGKSVLGVAQGFASGSNQAGITEIAHLLRAGMQAARRDSGERGRPASMIEAYKVLDQAGFAAVTAVVMESIAAVLGYSANGDGSEDDDYDGDDPN